MHVLAIAGSLRAASINRALCRTAARLAPAELRVTVFEGLGSLPLFNPDLKPAPPLAVENFRLQISRADALLIASPEYAHGVSGVMKNALDWLVSFEGFVGKPVAVINASARAHHAYEALIETLRTMSATFIADASVTLPLLGSVLTEDDMIRSPAVSSQVQGAMVSIHAFLTQRAAINPSIPVCSE